MTNLKLQFSPVNTELAFEYLLYLARKQRKPFPLFRNRSPYLGSNKWGA